MIPIPAKATHARQDVAQPAPSDRLTYWTAVLRDAPDMPAPPFAPPAPTPGVAGTGAFALPAGDRLHSAFRRAAQQHGCSIASLAQAVLALLAARLCDADDMVIGLCLGAADEHRVAPLRARLPAARDFMGLVEQLAPQEARACVNAVAHEALLERLGGEAAATRIYWAAYAYDDSAAPGADLQLSVTETASGLGLAWRYATKAISEEDARKAADCFMVLALAACEQPHAPLAGLPLLGPAMARTSLAPARALPEGVEDDFVHCCIARQAQLRPFATAIRAGDCRIGYGALQDRVNRLAHALRLHGCGQQQPVAVCLERGIDSVVAVLAVFQAGAAYLPLDATHPQERLAQVLADARPMLAIVQQSTRDKIGALRCLALDEASTLAMLAEAPADFLAPAQAGLQAEHLAYVIYTSGSTGVPKGVAIEHRHLAGRIHEVGAELQVDSSDVFPNLASHGFSFSLLEMLLPLAHGGSTVMVPPATVRDAPALAAACAGATIFHAVPSLMAAWLEHAQARDYQRLRCLLLGGDAVPERLLEGLAHAFPATSVIELYGQTETTIIATLYRYGGPRAARANCIGRPFAHAAAYILDRNGMPLPDGVAGELHIGGPGVGRGYFGRPELSAERFLPDPFAGRPEARMYRTGDLARRAADGQLEYLGRTDFQVKIHGVRIELGDIEQALMAHADVVKAVVTAHGDGLAAFILARSPGRKPGMRELRAWLRRRLPANMVPAVLVVLDAFPLTHNGKLDRKALVVPADLDRGLPYLAPANADERMLADCVAALLDAGRVGMHDNFFELGGHSLLASQLAMRVRRLHGVELPLHEIFDTPDLATLAGRIGALREVGAVSATIPRRANRAPVRASFAQERLWFLDRFQAPGAATGSYLMPCNFRLVGALDAGALRSALTALMQRHESLRTAFHETDGRPFQVIGPDANLPFFELDLSASRPEERDALLQEHIAAHDGKGFDLGRGPLLRACLVRLAPQSQVLLLNLHHSVSDGWSSGILARDLSALYCAALTGGAPSLPALPIQYADYAAWLHSEQESAARAAKLAYWQQRLAGMPAVSTFPADGARPAVQPHVDRVHRVAFPRSLADALDALCSRHEVTPFMVLASVFAVMLGRYADAGDVGFGTPVANRARPELEDLIGLFVNTVVVRADLDGAPSFAELLAQMKRTCLEAYAHQDLPFEQLVGGLQARRDLAHSPLVQVMFALQNHTRAELALPGIEAEQLPSPAINAEFDLMLLVDQHGADWLASFQYSGALYEAATVERMARHFFALLASAAQDSSAPLAALDMLDPDERRQVVIAFNAHTEGAEELPLALLFERQVARCAEAVAVHGEDMVLSYEELNRRADILALRLRASGVGPDTPVGICMERSAASIVAVVAVIKAGGAYVPLDPAFPQQRLRDMAAQTGMPVLLTHDAALDGVPAGPLAINLDRDIAWDAAATPFPCPAGSANLAYIMYTSGSTGTPKGVLIEQRSVARLVRNTDYADFSGTQVFFGYAPLGFDASTFEIWGALLNGHRLALAPAGQLSLRALGLALRRHQVTTLWLTAGLFHLMADEEPDSLAGLRQLLAGGDVLSPGVVRKLRAAYPELRIVNGYGPTENTTFTCCHQIGALEDGTTVPIGRPIRGTRVYLLDALGRPSAIGVPGEICTGGTGLARGYLNAPEATAEKFIADPFSAVAGERLYRTGDIGRWRADGTIEYLGRRDQQVKLRGLRIECGEIEKRLLDLPDVHSATVVAREDAPGDKRLVAYCVPARGYSLDAAALRTRLAAALPDYMVPSAFVELDALPLNANGKVDRRALPVPRYDAAEGEHVSPASATESVLAAAVADILGLERAGMQVNFFQLGGHSLLATRLVARLRRQLGIDLPLRAVFACPTLGSLASYIDTLDSGAGPAIARVARGAPLAASFAQERQWLLDRMEVERSGTPSPTYLMPLVLELEGVLDQEALRQALQLLVDRHEALRTALVETDGRPMQVVAAHHTVQLPVHDLDAGAAGGIEDEIGRQAERFGRRGFDLAAPSLLRCELLRVAPQRHVLLVNMHHCVSDGWSLGIFLRELGELYGQLSRALPATLPPLAVQYADYAAWQRCDLRADMLEEQRRYWQERLAGLPPLLSLPLDRPRPALQSMAGAHHRFVIPAPLATRLRALSQAHGCTLSMTRAAAGAGGGARLAAPRDLAFGTPVANRSLHEVEGLIGFFVNTVVLRCQLDGDADFVQLLGQMKQSCLEAYQHQELPFEQVVNALNPERSLAYAPLVQVLFALNGQQAAPAFPGLAARLRDPGVYVAKFDINVALEEKGEALEGKFEYSTALFDAATIARMATRFVTLLNHVARRPQDSLDRLALLDDEERRLVLEGFNATGRAYPAQLCVHHLFEQQAARTPDAPALRAQGAALSYAELDRAANRLAHHLRELGAGTDVLVGVCMERSLDMVVALLAILKAGAAYVPLDPDYPGERLQFMVADADAPIVIIQEHLAARLPATGATVLCADRDAALWRNKPSTAPQVASSARQLAYAIFTSGSTGRPKGALNEHRAVVNRLLWMQEHYQLDAHDRVLQKTPFSFDVSVWEFFWPLMVGATLVMARPGGHRDSGYLIDTIEREGITTVHFVPSMLQVLLQDSAVGGCRGLRMIMCSGEALPFDLVQRCYRLIPQAGLHNLYGPTECAVDVTWWSGPPAPGSSAIPIGRPVANTQIRILDRHGEPVPVGIAGELHIGGVQVGRGYLNRPELTAEKFIPDRFSADPEARLYRTGDLARWLADGNVEFLGRLDFQVKIRGLRIELGEIEHRITCLDGVREAVVLAREDHPGEQHLVAYIVQDGEVLAADALRAALRATLPEHMIPAVFLTLPALPLSPNGKVDRKALPRPQAAIVAATYLPPIGGTETALCALAAALLRLEQVGRNDNFFALGGHSLLATQLSSRVRDRFGVSLPLRSVFEAADFAALARQVEQLVASVGQPAGAQELRKRLDTLSEEQLLALLQAKRRAALSKSE